MYTIRRYNHATGKPNTVWEEIISENEEFCIATEKTRTFATIGHAVNFWGAICNRYYFKTWDRVWIEGPRGGRYNPTVGYRIR